MPSKQQKKRESRKKRYLEKLVSREEFKIDDSNVAEKKRAADRAYSKRLYRADPEKKKAYSKAAYREQPEKKKTYSKAYSKAAYREGLC